MDDDEVVEPFAEPTPEQQAKWKAAEVARLDMALRREALSHAVTISQLRNPSTDSIIKDSHIKDSQRFYDWLSGKSE